MILFFFFQAEDGIRDGHVTGVQTCALPISAPSTPSFCFNQSNQCSSYEVTVLKGVNSYDSVLGVDCFRSHCLSYFILVAKQVCLWAFIRRNGATPRTSFE